MRKIMKKLVKIKRDSFSYFSQKLELDINYFFKNGIWMFSAQMGAMLIMLLATIVLSRTLSVSAFGEYQFIMTIFGLITIFSLPELNTALIRSTSKGYFCLNQAIRYHFLFSLVSSFLLIVASIFFFHIKMINETLFYSFLVMSFFFPFYLSFEAYLSYLIGKKEFAKRTIFVLSLYTSYLLLVVPIVIFTQSILLIVFCFFFLFALFHLVFFLLNKKKEEEKAKKLEEKGFFQYGFQLSLISALPKVSTHIDKFILTYFLGLETLAIYAVALVIPQNLRSVLRTSLQVVMPKFVQVTEKDLKIKFFKISLYLLCSFSLFLIIIWFLIPPTILIVLGEKYAESVFYAQILFLGFIFIPFSEFLKSFLQAKKKTKSVLFYSLFNPGTKILLFLVLIPFFGIWGAIVTRIFSNFLLLIVLIYLVFLKGDNFKE
jgi:O-antigen/teichoic acid export membrane protein